MEEFLNNHSALSEITLNEKELQIIIFENKTNPLIDFLQTKKNLFIKNVECNLNNDITNFELDDTKFNFEYSKDVKDNIQYLSNEFLNTRYCIYENINCDNLKIGRIDCLNSSDNVILCIIFNSDFIEILDLYDYFITENNKSINLEVNSFVVYDIKGKSFNFIIFKYII